jgi:CRISPR-associated protein Cmr2
MNEILMKVQVGPVQEFIAQARSTRDMWAGSYLLAWLTAAAMKEFEEAGCEFIFPSLEQQPLYQMFNGIPSNEGLIPTLPNVFMILVREDQLPDLANRAKAALKAELRNIGDACWNEMKTLGASDGWKPRWDDQINRFPVFNWQAVPQQDNWSSTVERLGAEMAARRNTRDFEQWNGVAAASKDVLSGKEEIIGTPEFWKDNESFWKGLGPCGAMNTIKRLFPSAVLEKQFGDRKSFWENMRVEDTRDLSQRNRDTNNPYIAVLAMDGDQMGAALKTLSTQAEHSAFSQTLASFAVQNAAGIVKAHKGHLVYAGGDDVLAMCPANRALDLAEELCSAFRELMKTHNLDASCGIAVGHYKFPLQRIVEEARAAERRAKNKRGRAAFAMSLLKRSGEIIHWGGKWNSKALAVYRDFTQKTEDEKISGRFPYALAELLKPYRLQESPQVDLVPIIEKEFEHIQERQAQVKGATLDGAIVYLRELPVDRLEDFPNLFLASAFINRQRGEN